MARPRGVLCMFCEQVHTGGCNKAKKMPANRAPKTVVEAPLPEPAKDPLAVMKQRAANSTPLLSDEEMATAIKCVASVFPGVVPIGSTEGYGSMTTAQLDLLLWKDRRRSAAGN